MLDALKEIYAPISGALGAVDQAIVEIVDSPFPIPLEPFFQGGKRLRPAAVLFAARARGPEDDQAVRAAAVVELVHASSLIHDDIVDQAILRREVEALNYAHGESVAVLAGDYVFVRALRGAYALGIPPIVEELLVVVQDMVVGEFWEEMATRDQNFTTGMYYRIIGKKTASLFAGALKIGGLVRGAPEEELDTLFQTGYAYGMAFQILDDCVDLFDETDGDAKKGRWSLPALLLQEKGVVDLARPGMSLPKLREHILQEGGFQETLKVARRFAREAREHARALPDEVQEGLLRFLSTLDVLSSHVETILAPG